MVCHSLPPFCLTATDALSEIAVNCLWRGDWVQKNNQNNDIDCMYLPSRPSQTSFYSFAVTRRHVQGKEPRRLILVPYRPFPSCRPKVHLSSAHFLSHSYSCARVQISKLVPYRRMVLFPVRLFAQWFVPFICSWSGAEGLMTVWACSATAYRAEPGPASST